MKNDLEQVKVAQKNQVQEEFFLFFIFNSKSSQREREWDDERWWQKCSSICFHITCLFSDPIKLIESI